MNVLEVIRDKECVHIISTGDLDMDLGDVVQLFQGLQRLELERMKVLIDIQGGYVNMTHEVLEYMATHPINDRIDRLAVVARSLPNRLLANFYTRRTSFHYPAEVFDSREEAQAFCAGIKKGAS